MAMETRIFSGGALYWLNEELKTVTTFDLAEEKFCPHLSPPPLWPDSDWDFSTIGTMDGFLFFSVFLDDEEDMWLLKKKNDDHDMKEQPEEHQSMVWSRQFRIGTSELLAVTKTKGVLTYNGNYLSICDTKALTSKSLVDFEEQIALVIPHRNTLVSLKELGEEDNGVD